MEAGVSLLRNSACREGDLAWSSCNAGSVSPTFPEEEGQHCLPEDRETALPGKTAPVQCPGKPRPGSAGSGGRRRLGVGSALAGLQWSVAVEEALAGSCSQQPQLSRPFSFWAWLAGSPPSFSAGTEPGAELTAASFHLPEVCLWVSLCLCLSASSLPLSRVQRLLSPVSSSPSLVPGSQYGDPQTIFLRGPQPLFTSSEHSRGREGSLFSSGGHGAGRDGMGHTLNSEREVQP